MLNELIKRCAADMDAAAVSGKISLDEQVRAYDLLEALLDPSGPQVAEDAAQAYLQAYSANAPTVDVFALKVELEARLEPLRAAMNDARFEAAAAASLHEFAKEVFDTWQHAGIFARRRALRELRERAGFRLESHRIGNYVAKTFDLQNEAQTRFSRAQQAVFAADVTYKIKPGTYAAIYDVLKSR